jgi:hypothetical protein
MLEVITHQQLFKFLALRLMHPRLLELLVKWELHTVRSMQFLLNPLANPFAPLVLVLLVMSNDGCA